MAAFNVSITLGGTTRTRSGTATAAHITRFVSALRLRYPLALDDNAAVDAFLLEIIASAKQLTLQEERTAAVAASVNTIAQIDVT